MSDLGGIFDTEPVLELVADLRQAQPAAVPEAGAEAPATLFDIKDLGPEHLEVLTILARWPVVPSDIAVRWISGSIDGVSSDAAVRLIADLRLSTKLKADGTPDGRSERCLRVVAEDSGGDALWVTTTGLRAIGLDRRATKPTTSHLRHALAITRAADLIEASFKRRMGRVDFPEDMISFEIESGAEYVRRNVPSPQMIEGLLYKVPGNIESDQVEARAIAGAWQSKSAEPDLVSFERWHPLMFIKKNQQGHRVIDQGLVEQWPDEYARMAAAENGQRATWGDDWKMQADLLKASWSPVGAHVRTATDVVVAYEVQLSQLSASRWTEKVSSLSAGIRLGLWTHVCWIVESQRVYNTLKRELAQQTMVDNHFVLWHGDITGSDATVKIPEPTIGWIRM